MITAILYLLIGLISGFLTYWLIYRHTKTKMIEKASESNWRANPKHEDVKKEVEEKEFLPIVLSILLWPFVIFVVYPLMGITIGSCFMFNWIIDRIEGRKFDDNITKG